MCAAIPPVSIGWCSQYVDKLYGSASTTLYPTAEISALENHFHDYLGPHTRRVAYHYLLPDKHLILQICAENCGPTQAGIARVAWPWFRGMCAANGVESCVNAFMECAS